MKYAIRLFIKGDRNRENKCELSSSSSSSFLFFFPLSVKVKLWVIWKKFNQGMEVSLIENSPFSKGLTIC